MEDIEFSNPHISLLRVRHKANFQMANTFRKKRNLPKRKRETQIRFPVNVNKENNTFKISLET
jgi:hypothetical protein